MSLDQANTPGKYTQQLLNGGSPVSLRFFDRQVLDRYRQDPRYLVVEKGAKGWLDIKDEYFLDQSVPEYDKVGIQEFGNAYQPSGKPALAVILADLAQLSVNHQNHWSSFEIEQSCFVDPEYIKTSFEGEFTDKISPFAAFLQEFREINKLCRLSGEPDLFRDTFDRNPPEDFGWITKPTARDYSSLVQVFDKLISENLNKNFFRGKVELHVEIPRSDGKIQVQDKGTIQLLSEYLSKKWNSDQSDHIITTFRSIREERQTPAHITSPNLSDPNYFMLQKKLVHNAYGAVRKLRTLLMSEPKAVGYKPPDWLEHGRIE